MYLVAGLGNPGMRYDGTRHNMGFDTVTQLIDRYHVPLSGTAMKALYGKGRIEGEPVILIKPLTYMNLSGEAIQQFVHYYKIDPESELIVIYDDIDLEPGQIRIRQKGSAGSHNGMKSILSCLGTNTFTRVRVGIGAKPAGWDLADYVLSRPSGPEREAIDSAIADAAEAVSMIIGGNTEAAMGKFNRKNAPKQADAE
ncbi:MAG: aminoacyl-tRNA hydrolase [Eubacterium sp.]|nr:aminoacyl-tRNA hydrolase [Eubacterium sp.]